MGINFVYDYGIGRGVLLPYQKEKKINITPEKRAIGAVCMTLLLILTKLFIYRIFLSRKVNFLF